MSALFTERVLFALVWAVALALVAIALITDRNFWRDEAMVFQAIQNQGFVAPGVALELYEQALPYGVYVIEKLLITGFGLSETVLRLPGVAAYIIGLIALQWCTRMIGTAAGRLTAFAVGALSYQVILQAVMFKHYTFEFAATAVLVAVSLPLFAKELRRRSVAAFVVVFLFCLPFSNTVIFVALAIIGAALLLRVIERRPGSLRSSLYVAAGGVASLTLFGLWYVLVLHPSTLVQLSLTAYVKQGLVHSLYRYAVSLLGLFAPGDTALVFAAFALALGVVLAWGIWLSFRAVRAQPLPVTHLVLLLAVGGTIASSIIGIVPFASPRHLVFLMPLIALGLGSSVDRISVWSAGREPVSGRRQNQRQGARRVIVAGLAAVLLLTGVIAAFATKQEAGSALAATAGVCSDVYVDYTLQPSAMIYLQRDEPAVRLHGLVSANSGLGKHSWYERVTGNMPAYKQQAVDYFATVQSSCVLTLDTDLLIRPIEASGFTCAILASKNQADIYDCTRVGASHS
jgi:hypothetical protein